MGAAHSAPPIAVNAQIGQVHFPVTCQILGSLNQTFEVLATGGAPAYGATGSDYFLTDTVGHITIPEDVVALAAKLNASQAAANMSIYVDSSNASPASLLAFQGVVSLQFPLAGSADLRFPGGNDTLPPVGPYTIGSSPDPSRLLIGRVEVSLDLQNSTGQSVSGPITVSCGKQNMDLVVASVSIENSDISNDTDNGAPANGYVPTFPSVPLNYQYGFFRFPYNCVLGALGPQALDLTIGGQIGTFFIPGESFYLSKAESYLRLPASIVKLAKTGFPNVTTIHTTVSDFELLFSNSNPGSVNAAATPLVSNVDITDADITASLVIPIPAYSDLTIGPVCPEGKVGDFVSLAAGNATGVSELQDADGNVLFSIDVSCSPYSYLELIGVVISDQQPYNYSLGKDLNA